ncbi:MAG TPA: transposase, partial [Bacteroidales bacterium]|nr:transposase [Bacteroidales bacterium]
MHCLIPAAGYSIKGEWKTIGKNGRYLYPVLQLSTAFKGKFLDSLKRKLRKMNKPDAFVDHIKMAYAKPWVVHCEPALAKADHVVQYLGQYTHRVAITNQRILDITDTHVTFIAKDYRDRAQKKPVRLKGKEFLRRFAQHILPKGFVRIRRFGIYHHTTKRNLELQFVPDKKPDIDSLERAAETSAERILRLTGFDPGLCPCCKKGRMQVKREIPRIRSPAKHLLSLLRAACL